MSVRRFFGQAARSLSAIRTERRVSLLLLDAFRPLLRFKNTLREESAERGSSARLVETFSVSTATVAFQPCFESATER